MMDNFLVATMGALAALAMPCLKSSGGFEGRVFSGQTAFALSFARFQKFF